ncbi:hypothetical protein [Kitasatospora sp. NPDC056800]|uniref:hypothetical protein n=1 Tax=Kitasatospora sp. NPDC056800 TaxID=3345948 RepID=UPI00367F3750
MVKAPQPADGEAAAGARSLTFTTTRPLIPPALNSAAKIVHFLQLHGFDEEAVEMFSVLYGDAAKPIPWHRFCYHPGTAADLHQVLADGPPPHHPVAFYGTVTKTDDKGGTAYATLATGQRPHDGGRPFSVRLRTQHPALLNQLRPGRHILAIGTWKLWPQAHEVRLWLEAHWQLAYWDTDPATGAPRGISCPRPLPANARTVPTRPPRAVAPGHHPAAARTTPVRPHPAARPRPAPAPNDSTGRRSGTPLLPPAASTAAPAAPLALPTATAPGTRILATHPPAGTRPFPGQDHEPLAVTPPGAPAESQTAKNPGPAPARHPVPEPGDYLLAPPAAVVPAAPRPAPSRHAHSTRRQSTCPATTKPHNNPTPAACEPASRSLPG